MGEGSRRSSLAQEVEEDRHLRSVGSGQCPREPAHGARPMAPVRSGCWGRRATAALRFTGLPSWKRLRSVVHKPGLPEAEAEVPTHSPWDHGMARGFWPCCSLPTSSGPWNPLLPGGCVPPPASLVRQYQGPQASSYLQDLWNLLGLRHSVFLPQTCSTTLSV